jgi:hypothetical protein
MYSLLNEFQELADMKVRGLLSFYASVHSHQTQKVPHRFVLNMSSPSLHSRVLVETFIMSERLIPMFIIQAV